MHNWRRLPALLLTPPGRCRLRREMVRPFTPMFWTMARVRRGWLPATRTVVAVTGSFGKTTTARAVRCVLGLPVGLTAGPNSGDSLARAIMAMSSRAPAHVFEVGISRPGQMAPTARAVAPTVAVVTSIGSEHALSLATLERTRAEKVELVRALQPDGVAVLNGDDPNVRWMSDQAPGSVITFGAGEDNDVQAESVELDWPRGMRIGVRVGAERLGVRTKLFGHHQVGTILAALGVARAVGMELAIAVERLAAFDPTPGRMQIVPLPGGVYLLRDEYKSGLETINHALDTFARIPARRRIILLGEITEPPAPQHPKYVELGQRVAGVVDRAVIAGKKTDGYRTGLKRGGLAREHIVDAGRSWRRAYEALAGMLEPGDVVLLKGRHDERLERVALALSGRKIGCELTFCNTPLNRCDTCAMLESGWGKRTPVM